MDKMDWTGLVTGMNVQCVRIGVGTGTSDADTLWSNVRYCRYGWITWTERVDDMDRKCGGD